MAAENRDFAIAPDSYLYLQNIGSGGVIGVRRGPTVATQTGQDEPVKLRLAWPKAILFGIYFSVLSAFSVGWREFNIGSWIVRIQSGEYSLHATGWVRSVSGIQSVISVYLLAIWALTYFGRPFQ